MLDLFKNIKARRKELHMTQEELALKVGYTNKSTIATIEAGKMNIPVSKILQIADALEIDASELMGWSSDLPESNVNFNEGIVLPNAKLVKLEGICQSLDEEKIDRLLGYAQALKEGD